MNKKVLTIISAFTERISKEEEPIEPVTTEVADVIDINVSAEVMENEDYQLPSLNLLETPTHSDQSGEYNSIQANAKKLEQTFLSFGVKAKVTQVHLVQL